MHDGNELGKAKLDFCRSDEENGKLKFKLYFTWGQQMWAFMPQKMIFGFMVCYDFIFNDICYEKNFLG